MELENLFSQSDHLENKAPEKENPLKSLETDLKLYNDSIREVAIEIIMEGISSQPIFVAHQHKVALGECILDKDELNTSWSIHASTLEEFIERGIIDAKKKEIFLNNYKNPHDFMSLLVIVPEGANFVFYPYHQ